MVTTTWLGGSGAWDDAANWSNGIPGADDDAVIPEPNGQETISGGGAAAELTVQPNPSGIAELTFSGSYSVGEYLQSDSQVILASSATLAFNTATLSSDGAFGAGLDMEAGASLGSGTLTLSDAGLTISGDLSNPLLLSGAGVVSGTGTLSGLVSGSGALNIGPHGAPAGYTQLTDPANDFTGGVVLADGALELATAAALGSGSLSLDGGALSLDAGVSLPPLSTGDNPTTISAATASQEVFGSALTFINGSGASTVIGGLTPGYPYPLEDEGPASFGTLQVQGGSGNVTVFGGNDGGTIYGGTAGNNVIVAGASLAGLTPVGGGNPNTAPFYTTSSGELTSAPGAVTIVGGGSSDLLVATGFLNNLVAAGSGNETLSAAGATGNNELFGGSGSDLIAAGSGHDTVVAGTGASTIFGGAGGTDIFAEASNAVIVDGAGGDYVQAGSGDATIFAGSGSDLFGVFNGQAGGSDVIAGFKNGIDHIELGGYASAPAVSSQNGSTTITLSDNTSITLLGVGNLAPNTFV